MLDFVWLVNKFHDVGFISWLTECCEVFISSGLQFLFADVIFCAPFQALDKIRFESLTDKSKLDAQPELFIHIVPDKTNNTLSIIDSGIGMTKAGRCHFWHYMCLTRFIICTSFN